MADSSALRSRRSRAHARGDHSWCRHGPPDVTGVSDDKDRARRHAEAWLRDHPQGRLVLGQALLALRPPGDAPVDPHVSLERLAGRLETAHEADPGNALLARELRATLVALAGDDPDSGLDVG